MKASLAGAWVPRERSEREALSRRLAAVGGVLPAAVLAVGDLLVVGGRAGRAGHVTCVLNGSLDEPPPGAGPDEIGADALARSFARLGEGILGALRGDYAMVLWDADTDCALIARDALGGPGVHLATEHGALLFASEVTNLLALLSTRPCPDDAAVAHWLSGSGPPGTRTMFAGIDRLPGGHLARPRDGRWHLEQWWHPCATRGLALAREDAEAELRARLRRAVRRCAGPEEAGVQLSGGLDSGAVAGLLAAERPDHRLRTYSAVFPRHPSIDESHLIEELTRRLGLRARLHTVTGGSILAGASGYIDRWALPPVSPNLVFWVPLLRHAAADRVSLLLDGEGGDEVFGTARYLIADLIREGHPLAALELARRFPGAGSSPGLRPLLMAVADFGVRGALPPRLHQLMRRARRSAGRGAPWLRPELERALARTDGEWDWKEVPGPRWQAGLVDALTNTDGAVLARDHVRLRGALAGVRLRHPLIDVDVIELMLALDPRWSFDPKLNRPLMRAAVAGLIPDSVRLRPQKSRFDALFRGALVGEDLAPLHALLGGPDAEIGAYCDQHVLRDALLERPGHASALGMGRWAIAAWRAATLELWLRAQSAGETALFSPCPDSGAVLTSPCLTRT